MKIKSLYKEVVKRGIPYSSYHSDLYIPVTPETTELVNNYEYRCNVSTFVSNIDGKLWYDVIFGFEPWFEKHGMAA